MRCTVVPVFILLILSQTFSKWIIVVDYNINGEFIASNLCINESQAARQCKGKCQLNKRMASDNTANKGTSGILKRIVQNLHILKKKPL
jgi:hypothetical protein